MTRMRGTASVAVVVLVPLLVVSAIVAAQDGRAAEQRDMRLVGHHDLQGRSAYQPVVHRQGSRVIAYVGHHSGSAVNPLTGAAETNGTSVLDVTDPHAPRYLGHIPSESQAQMVRVCGGDALPRGARGKSYLLRTAGHSAHEVWDVTDPGRAQRVTVVARGLRGTHKNWWECETGIAYLVSGDPAWRTDRMTKIYDLSDPARPRFIRDFGLPGQEPGASGEIPPGVHGPIARGHRVYFAYGTSANGVLQIVDREKLLRGRPTPTPASLREPEVGRLAMPPDWGGHTSFPLLGMEIAEFAKNASGRVRDFVVLVSESLADRCRETRHLTFLVDVTTESRPFPVATWQVPEASGGFCGRGGRFGPHATNESFTPLYYRKLVFVSYFNAGVRAVDVRDPFQPREVAFFIPGAPAGRAIQTNNVEVDDRGYIYITDRAGAGLHILELTGAARSLAGR